MPRRKDISNDLSAAIVGAHQSGKGYKAIFKLCGVHHSTERKVIHKWKRLKAAVNLPRSGKPASSPQGEKPKSYISDSPGLS